MGDVGLSNCNMVYDFLLSYIHSGVELPLLWGLSNLTLKKFQYNASIPKLNLLLLKSWKNGAALQNIISASVLAFYKSSWRSYLGCHHSSLCLRRWKVFAGPYNWEFHGGVITGAVSAIAALLWKMSSSSSSWPALKNDVVSHCRVDFHLSQTNLKKKKKKPQKSKILENISIYLFVLGFIRK